MEKFIEMKSDSDLINKNLTNSFCTNPNKDIIDENIQNFTDEIPSNSNQINSLSQQNKQSEYDNPEEDLKIYKTESLIVDVIFRRKFGKKLCFVNGVKSDKTQIEIKIQNYELIRQVKIGDRIEVKGYFKFDKFKNKFLYHCIELEIKLKCPKDFNIFGTRLKTSSEDQKNEKALCKFYRKNEECKIENCIFRHFLLPEEEVKLMKLRENQVKMYQESHEGDTINDKDKKSKSIRNKLFAEFLVKTYGLEYLKSGPILDVAGGKGLVSFYLTTVYDLESIIIDARGVTLPKKYAKQLKESNKSIEERRMYFDENFDKDLITRSSLIIGMHPDEATDFIIDVAVKNIKKFAVVPCCVFPKIFTQRFLNEGDFVSDYPKYIKFIQEKVPEHKLAFLEIVGRNKIIYID